MESGLRASSRERESRPCLMALSTTENGKLVVRTDKELASTPTAPNTKVNGKTASPTAMELKSCPMARSTLETG